MILKTHLLTLLCSVLISCQCTVAVYAATYYVAMTGSDSNPGTSANPWKNPQKCASSPIQAGDTCIIRSGIYTAQNGQAIVVYASGTSPSGTSSQPITIKSEKPLEAVIIVPSAKDDAVNAGFYITRSYYIIEGFDINGGSNDGAMASHSGIVFYQTTGGVARLNAIHHIGKTICSDSPYGKTGMLINRANNVLIEQNLFYSIGRLRDGESGCSTTISSHDHGVYIKGASNLIVRRNVFYDTNCGYPLHVFGGTTINLDISHNTFSGHSPTGKPAGHILLASTINGASIKNNISSDAQIGMVNTYALTASNVTVSYNLSDTLEKTGLSVAGVTFSNNIQRSTNLGFVDKSHNDFRLTSASAAINRGTIVGVPPVRDGLPDIGFYEYSEQNNQSSPAAPIGLVIR
jgi:hypothetical protein